MNLSFVRDLQSPSAGVKLSGKRLDDGQFAIFSERSGPSSEAIDAFVLTFRFFTQDNEDSSLRNIASIYHQTDFEDDLSGSCSGAAGSGLTWVVSFSWRLLVGRRPLKRPLSVLRLTGTRSKYLMQTKTLQDGAESFKVSVYEATKNSPVVLFAVGAGGLPERHATLLDTLTESGCMVVAPHFERLASPVPRDGELTLRAKRLSLALDAFVEPGATVAGVGHSIGAATLVALVGAQMWLGPGKRVHIAPDSRLTRLVLLAPPTGFFQAPGALEAVRVPILAWAGSEDSITPPAQTEWLAHAMRDWQIVDVRVTDGAGHFSFMDVAPPHTTEPLPNKQAFLREYSSEVCKFVIG